MNLKRVDIFQAKTIRGAPKMPTELRYCIEVIVASPATDCGPSCPRSCGGEEGRSQPSENLLSQGWGCEKPTILSDRRQLLRPPLNCRASGFVQSQCELHHNRLYQPAAVGRHVCCGRRQSMPSSKYPSCAGVIVTVRSAASASAVDGHTNRPRSNRFANRHMPWPSCHSTLIRPPRRPRNTNRWPLCGLRLSVSCTSSAKPSKPLRISVCPVASHTCMPLGIGIIG